MLLVYRYRVKSLCGLLNQQARSVNFIWNYCNDVQKFALKHGKLWPSGFDLNRLTTGCANELGVHSGTVNAVCEQYAKSRRQARRAFLRYRGRRSLGWVPFKGRDLKRLGRAFRFHGRTFRVFCSRPIPAQARIRDGSNFACDARGRWFLNVVLELPPQALREPKRSVAIDPGLEDFATLSTGEKIENPRHSTKFAMKLATAQRGSKHAQVKKIHARIANSRRDSLHKLSVRLVREFDCITVGNISPVRLAKTSLAKSVLDAGWSSFRDMLRYKAIAHGARYEEVDEAFSTRLCSECGALGGPKGIAGLGIRQWVCGECGQAHDRDVNAARNLLARSGHRTPAEGIHADSGRGECQTAICGLSPCA